MEQITVAIKNRRKKKFFLDLISELDFIEIIPSKKLSIPQEKLLRDFRDAFRDIALHESGKKKLKTADELLNEL